MDSNYTRTSALQFAVSLGHKDAATLVMAAEAINAFLAAAPDQPLQYAAQQLGATNQQTEKTEAPKDGTRRRRTATTAGSDTKAAESNSTSAPEEKPATDKETDDLFGDPEPAKEEKVKEVTIDDVRAKLVEVQTKFKHKDHALACLKKISGGMVLSGLKKEDHGKLVDLCTEVLKKDTPPKF